MTSEDKGEFWQYQKLSDGFTDIAINKGVIYLSTLSDTVIISADDGNTWNYHKLNIDSLLNISVFNDKIILNTKTNKIYYTNNINEKLTDISNPFNYTSINTKNNLYYVYSNSQIAELTTELTWNIFDVSIGRSFKFIPEEDSIVIFSANESNRSLLGLETYTLDKNTKQLSFISKFRNELLITNYPMYTTEFEPNDIVKLNDEYILSTYYKTILKTENLEDYDIILNSHVYPSNFRNIFDENFIVANKPGTAEFIRSSNGGRTFNIDKHIESDTIDNRELVPELKSMCFVDKDNALLLLKTIGNYHDGTSNTFSKSFIEIKNGQYQNLQLKLGSIENSDILANVKNKYIIIENEKILKTVENEKGKIEDSLYINHLFTYSDNKIDTLEELKEGLLFPNIVEWNNKIYFCGNMCIAEPGQIKYQIYSIDEDFKNLSLVSTFDFIADQVFFEDNGNITAFTNEYIYIFDSNFKFIRKIQTRFHYLNAELKFKGIKNTYFIGTILSDDKYGNPFSVRTNYRFYINDNYEVVEVENKENIINFRNSMFNNVYYYYLKSFGALTTLNIPIEQDKKEYYLSVTNKQESPQLWAYPPYPNPVKDKFKMKFFANNMTHIANLKVEIIEIGTGKRYKINDYKLLNISDFSGEIEIDITNRFKSGGYIINLNINGTNVNESLIIE